MVQRRLGTTDLELSPLGFGAFKIGRNQGIKYEQAYELPSDKDVSQLLNAVLDAGVNYIDTAPAYGLSEERIGFRRVMYGSEDSDEVRSSVAAAERFYQPFVK